MKREGIIFCDKPDCREPDKIIHPADPGHLNYGKVDYHADCYVDYLRSKGAIVPRTAERIAS